MTVRRIFRRAALLVPAVLLAGHLCTRGQEANPRRMAAVAQQDARQRAVERQVYDQLLLRDRRSRLVLDRARQDIERGNAAAGLELLQQLLDRPDDVFVWIDTDTAVGEGSRLSSLRTEIDRLLTGSGGEVIETYGRLYGPEADRLLLEARRTGEPGQFREVARRFFHTEAGFQATDWLAARWLNHGQYATAARAWSRLVEEPIHQARVSRELIAKSALAWHLAGDRPRARETLDSLKTGELRSGGRTMSADGWLAGLPDAADVEVGGRPGEWPMFLGSPDRMRTLRATTPYPQPVWSVSFLDGQPLELPRLLQQWESLQAANLQPTAVANHPLVVAGLVVIRDWDGLRAFELATGRSVWAYRSAMSLAEAGKRKSVFDAAYERRGLTVAPSGQPELNLKQAFAENSLHGTLSSDGERIYAVELADVRWPRSAGRLPNIPPDDRARSANRLIALPVRLSPAAEHAGTGRDAASSIQPVWAVGGPAPIKQNREVRSPPANDNDPGDQGESQDAEPREPQSLAGYFFLGPPLPLDGRLYALAEEGRELKLVVLEPESGRTLWIQSLAGVDLPIEQDASRYFRACTPSFARGVLVCPTGHGLLIGLDPFDGTLLWSRFCGDRAATGPPVDRRGGVVSREDYGHGGFNAAPQIHGWHVLYLPPESDAVSCLDLRSGEVHWTLQREDAEYVAAVADDLVLIVGSESCRGVALDSGEVRWQVRHGTPAGRGLPLGGRYLLPLADGRVITIDLNTGREVGNSHIVSSSRWPSTGNASLAAAVALNEDELLTDAEAAARRPGNLVASAGMVVSVGPRGVAVFRETGALREEIHERLRRQPDVPRDQLLAAELELMQGQLDAGETLLLAVLSGDAGDDERQRAAALLRELLYLRLDEGADPEGILARLEPLSQGRAERARFLLRMSDLSLDLRRLDAVRELSAIEVDELLPDPENPQRRLSAARWARSIIERLAHTAGDEARPVLQARLAAERDAALDTGDVEALRRFVAIWSGWPEASSARLELAERLVERGRLHEAELVLLEGRNQSDPVIAAESTRRLLTLWDAHGLSHDAAGLLDELATKFADVPLDGGQTGREFAGTFAARESTRAAYRMQTAALPAVNRVRVTERLWLHNDPRLIGVYRTQTPVYATPADSPFQVLISRGDGREGQLSVLSHETGTVINTVSVPLATAYPAISRTAAVGHFFPIGDVGSVSGVSLLERWHETPLWTLTPRDLSGRTDVIRVGPAGPTFCALQARRFLAVVDPADGRLLWQRTDVTPSGEPVFDASEAIIGDDHVLVVFSADRRNYVVYDTASGRELRTGTLDLDSRQVHRVFGRRLVYLSHGPGGRRLKIWDPLTDRVEYESDAGDLLISTPIDDRELAFVLPRKQPEGRGLRPFSRLVIIDVPTAEVKVDVDLGSDRLMHLNYLRAFRDRDRYYVNFQRSIANRGARHYSYFATDTHLPSEHMQGDLYALDAASGAVLWSRVIPQRSFLRLPGVRLPFLVALARARDRWNGGQQSLVLEVFDARTGETLGWKDDLFPDRLGQFAYDAVQQRLELSGWHTTIRLDFGPSVLDVPTGESPF